MICCKRCTRVGSVDVVGTRSSLTRVKSERIRSSRGAVVGVVVVVEGCEIEVEGGSELSACSTVVRSCSICERRSVRGMPGLTNTPLPPPPPPPLTRLLLFVAVVVVVDVVGEDEDEDEDVDVDEDVDEDEDVD